MYLIVQQVSDQDHKVMAYFSIDPHLPTTDMPPNSI